MQTRPLHLIRCSSWAVATVAVCAVFASAQGMKRIVLSPKSNISTSEVAEGFRKYCPNVLVTEDASKADYTLEAAETVSVDDGESSRHWYFALLDKDGDVIFTSHPKFSLKGTAHHFEDTCKFINGGQTTKKKKR